MSSRDDSFLNTGLSSAMGRRIIAKQKERTQEKQQVRATLAKSDELLIAEITKARREIANEVANIIHAEMDEQTVKVTVLGLKLADKKMIDLQTRLLNLLRVGAKDEQ